MNHTPSPDTSDAGIERLIQAKGKTAPRVTPADIEANITGEFYFTAAQGAYMADVAAILKAHPGKVMSIQDASPGGTPLDLLTFCVLVLRNGFTVTGEAYCADPAKFNAETGRIEARQNAVQKIWPLMVYELRSRLAASADAGIPIDDQDFLAGSQACNLEDGICEACQ